MLQNSWLHLRGDEHFTIQKKKKKVDRHNHTYIVYIQSIAVNAANLFNNIAIRRIEIEIQLKGNKLGLFSALKG